VIDRRAFLAGTGAVLLAAPLVAEGQQAGKMPRVGMLFLAGRVNEFVKGFEDGMTTLGYVDGRTVVYEHRFANWKPELLAGHAAEMVRLKVDVIVALNTTAAVAAQTATKTIPIVVPIASDPVGSGLVASLARPGGNVTGLSLQFADVAGKRVQLLQEVLPTLSQLSLLFDPTLSGNRGVVQETEASASRVGLRLQILEARNSADLDTAFAAMTREGARAVIVWGSDDLFVHRARIAELAAKARLAVVCPFREYVEAGCLMSYSANPVDLCRRAATYVAKILKGAKPGDLPVEQPTKFDLVINLKTAKALGLTIPPSLLGRADQVIE
jgi:putative tryptophan/tyrosine transport system substrate-binding protein